METDPYRYRAFISYSHVDSTMAQWLHRRLESFVVPKRLAGLDYGMGPIPRRLGPVFLDREELPTSADLGAVIRDALRESQYLIVICSINAASSRWVNEEIRAFKALGRGHRIFGLIVDGEPCASDRRRPELECFPHALRHDVQPDGSLAPCASEPIAADLRPGHDDRASAALRIVAGLIGVRYDELRQRERRRRTTLWLGRMAMAAALLIALGALWFADRDRLTREAEAVYLQKLFVLGRDELLHDHPARAAAYLGAAYIGGLDAPGLRMVLHEAMKSVDPIVPLPMVSDPLGTLVGWLPDGQRFAAYGRRLEIRDASGKLLVTSSSEFPYSNHKNLVVSSDGRRVLVQGQVEYGNEPISVDLYDVADGRLLMHEPATLSQADSTGLKSISEKLDRFLVIDATGAAVEHDLSSGARLRSIRTPAMATSTAYSPDSRTIVIGQADGYVSVVDAPSGRVLLHFDSGSRNAVRALYTPDASRLMVTDERGRLRSFNVYDGRLVDALGGHEQRVAMIKFSADGRRLLTQARDATKVWDWRSGELLLETRCQCKEPTEATIDDDGSHLSSPMSESQLGIWNVDERRIDRLFEPGAGLVFTQHFSPDGHRLLATVDGGDAVLLTTGLAGARLSAVLHHEPALLAGDESETFSGRFSPDGRLAVTSGTDGTARVWDTSDGHLVHVLRGHTQQVYHAAFSPDGRQLATASDDLTARLWNLDTGAQVATLGGHNRFVRRVVYSPDGSTLLTVAGTEPKLWKTHDGKLVATLTGLSKPAIEGSFSTDGRRVMTTGIDGIPRLFDTATGKLQAQLVGHEGVVPFASFTDHDRVVLSAGTDGTLRTWSARDGTLLGGRKEPLAGTEGFRDGVISHDGERVLLATATGELMLWNWRSNGKLQRLIGHTAASFWMEFSSDDRFAISASNDGSARLWDLSDNQTLQVFSTPNHAVRLWSASINPAMTQVITAGRGTPATAELWNIGRETRDRQTLAKVLSCKSSWEVDGDRLVAHVRDTGACGASAAVMPTTVAGSAP